MEKVEITCSSCSPDTPIYHKILKNEDDIVLQCDECGAVQRTKTPKKIQIRVIVSKGEEAFHKKALLSGIINIDDELIIDDEETGEAEIVKITAIEVGDKRVETAKAQEIKTLWARSISEVIIKIAINKGEITESLEMKVSGDREFVVGEKIDVNNRSLKIIRIKLRGKGFKSRKGSTIKASDIKRIYADTGIKMLKKKKIGGERIVIKKRDSVWSLKNKKSI